MSHLIVYGYCPDSYRDGQPYSHYLASEGDIDPSEVQKQFLEGCSKHIKKDLKIPHPNVLALFQVYLKR